MYKCTYYFFLPSPPRPPRRTSAKVGKVFRRFRIRSTADSTYVFVRDKVAAAVACSPVDFFPTGASRVRDKRVNQSDKPGTCVTCARDSGASEKLCVPNGERADDDAVNNYPYYFPNVGPSVSTRQTVVIRKFISSRSPTPLPGVANTPAGRPPPSPVRRGGTPPAVSVCRPTTCETSSWKEKNFQ